MVERRSRYTLVGQLVERRLALCVALFFGLAACQEGLEMRIAPGSTADNLVFELSDEGKTAGVNVREAVMYTCEQIRNRGADGVIADVPVWWVMNDPPGNAVATGSRIRYGVAQGEGLLQVHGTSPLSRPGCYFVTIRGAVSTGHWRTGGTGLRIEADGSVREMSRREQEKIWSRG
jgi:hypothetical protein